MTQPQKKMRCGRTNNHNAQSQGFEAPFIQSLVIKDGISNAVAIDYEFNNKRVNISYLTSHPRRTNASADLSIHAAHFVFTLNFLSSFSPLRFLEDPFEFRVKALNWHLHPAYVPLGKCIDVYLLSDHYLSYRIM